MFGIYSGVSKTWLLLKDRMLLFRWCSHKYCFLCSNIDTNFKNVLVTQ